VKEMPQAKPKLPSWRVPMRSLAAREFLADEESGPPLLGWISLLDQQVMAPLESLVAPVELGDSSLENFAASAEGDEDEISTGIGNSAPGGLACWTTGTFTSCSSIVSSAMSNWKGKCQCSSLRKGRKGHTSGWGIGRFWL
jgi:hypothetical protein